VVIEVLRSPPEKGYLNSGYTKRDQISQDAHPSFCILKKVRLKSMHKNTHQPNTSNSIPLTSID
jgi:hypothetical protein